MVRAGNIADAELGRVARHFLFQRKTAFQRAGLFRGPGPDPAAARAGLVILVRLFRADLRDQPAHPHLAAQRLPVEAHGGLAGRQKLAPLGAFQIRVEHEAALIEILQQHHAHIRQSTVIDRRDRYRVGVVDLFLRGVRKPFSKKLKRFRYFREVTFC